PSARGSLPYSVNGAGQKAGVKNNTSGNVSSNEPGPGTTPATASITVVAPPTISKMFGASTIPLGGSTTLSFTVNNPNTTAAGDLSGVAFTDTLPAGFTLAAGSSPQNRGNPPTPPPGTHNFPRGPRVHCGCCTFRTA